MDYSGTNAPSLVVQKFRMPTPTHRDPAKIMAGQDFNVKGTK